MPASCVVYLGLLCLTAPAAERYTVTRVPFVSGHLGAYFDIKGSGLHVGTMRTNHVGAPFKLEDASQVCVGKECVPYHGGCEKKGEATHCVFDLPDTIYNPVELQADNDAALAFALNNIAVSYAFHGGQEFTLALFAANASASPPDKK